MLDHLESNIIGDFLKMCFDKEKLKHIGQHFQTYISSRCATAPDIFLSNCIAYINIHLTPSPVATSDSIPTIAKIRPNPIQIHMRPRPQLSKVDWPRIKEELESFGISTGENPAKDDIDRYVL